MAKLVFTPSALRANDEPDGRSAKKGASPNLPCRQNDLSLQVYDIERLNLLALAENL